MHHLQAELQIALTAKSAAGERRQQLRAKRAECDAVVREIDDAVEKARQTLREAAGQKVSGDGDATALERAKKELSRLMVEAEFASLELEGANDVVRASEHAEDEAGKRVNKLASEIAVLAAPEIERAALEIAQKLGLLLASHRALAVFARIQATTAAGSLRDPIAGSAGENTNFKRAVAETVESTRIAQFTIGDMLRLELPATAEAAE